MVRRQPLWRPPGPLASRLGVGLVASVFLAHAGGCSHAWDDLDPRLGAGGDDAAASTGTGATTTSTTSTVTQGSTGTPTTTSGGGGGDGPGTGGAGGGDEGGSAPSTTTSTGEGAGGAGGGTSTSTGEGGAGGGILSVEYTAVVAECIDPANPDPAFCEADAGPDALTVDVASGGHAWHAFLRFEPDAVLAGRVVLAVELRLTVADYELSQADQSGEIWEVEPFEAADLLVASPAQVPGALLSPDQGAVVNTEVVLFPLDGLAVAADTPVYLGLFPVTDDGVDYVNAEGLTPPTLIVTYR